MITMLLGGLWHGSSWNFVIWGGIHGLVLSVEKFVMSKHLKIFENRIVSAFGYITTFTIVCFAWIFFRKLMHYMHIDSIRLHQYNIKCVTFNTL